MDSKSICISWYHLLYFCLLNTAVLYCKKAVTVPALVIGVIKVVSCGILYCVAG